MHFVCVLRHENYFYRESFYLFFLILKKCSFIFERERGTVQVGEGHRERETKNLKQIPGSELSAQSPMRGLNPQTARS